MENEVWTAQSGAWKYLGGNMDIAVFRGQEMIAEPDIVQVCTVALFTSEPVVSTARAPHRHKLIIRGSK
jgi:hypothetical protein